jgi:hypothetical protein
MAQKSDPPQKNEGDGGVQKQPDTKAEPIRWPTVEVERSKGLGRETRESPQDARGIPDIRRR